MTANPHKLSDKMYDGFITILSDGQNIHVPYLFVVEEPNYPRVMGFDFGAGDTKEPIVMKFIFLVEQRSLELPFLTQIPSIYSIFRLETKYQQWTNSTGNSYGKSPGRRNLCCKDFC